MTARDAIQLPPARRRPRRAGFSFVEVLFAVMILGIGFIMLAGIFPVAMQQTADTQDETIGAAIARGAVTTFESFPGLSNVFSSATPGTVIRLEGGAWNAIKGNQILPQDSRYGWVAMLKRQPADYRNQAPGYAQLIIVPVFVRRETGTGPNPGFNAATDLDQQGSGSAATATLMPLAVKATLTDGGTGVDSIMLSGTGVGAAASGAVVVLANGTDSNGKSVAGRAYRLGNPVGTSTTNFQLLPGSDLADASDKPGGAVDAWIVGRAIANPGSATPTFDGPSMAIGVYSTFVSIR